MAGISGGLGRHHVYSRGGQLWNVTPTSPSTTYTGQISLVATTPTFLIRMAEATAANRVLPLKMRLSQSGTVAGGNISVAILMDNTDRLSGSTGTIIEQAQPYMRAGNTSAFTVRGNPTATAASSAIRTLDSFEIIAQTGDILEYDFDAETMIEGTGSILIYTWAATTGPTWKPLFQIAQEPML